MSAGPPPPRGRRALPGADEGEILRWVGAHLGFRTSGTRGDFLTARIEQILMETGVRPSELLARLEVDGPERRQLTELVTITETSFFRNPPQMDLFAEVVLPKLVETRRRSSAFKIRLWSAGCSIGAEPYSLAMILLEGIALPEAWDIEILATDVNPAAIKRVEEGVFTSRELDGVDKARKGRFFENLGAGRWRVIPELRRIVRAAPHNLAGPPPPGPFDVIFCRNLLIYFQEETVRAILNHFTHCVAADGALFLGHSEFPGLHSTRWRLMATPDAVCYRVTEPTERS